MLWQNSDEEEFNWEAMSPTLADHSRSENFLPSSISSLRNFKARPDYGPSRIAGMDSDIRNRWSGQGHLPAADDSSSVTDDAVPSYAVCFLNLFPTHSVYLSKASNTDARLVYFFTIVIKFSLRFCLGFLYL